MRIEYLLFDLAVFTPPFVLSWVRGPTYFAHRLPRAFAAIAVAAIPFVVWDVLVAGDHWWFADEYTLGWRVLGLPIEEWGFFIAVPFACLYTWEILLRAGRDPPRRALLVAQLALLALIPVGAWVLATTAREYTGLSLLCVGLAALVDLASVRLLAQPRTWLALLAVAGLTVVCNNYLTGRPIVIYDASAQLDVRLWTMPVEDLGFGLGLMLLTFDAYAGFQRSLFGDVGS